MCRVQLIKEGGVQEMQSVLYNHPLRLALSSSVGKILEKSLSSCGSFQFS